MVWTNTAAALTFLSRQAGLGSAPTRGAAGHDQNNLSKEGVVECSGDAIPPEHAVAELARGLIGQQMCLFTTRMC